MAKAKSRASGAAAPQAFSYDEVPYESFSYIQTHPDHLYTIGRLFNMTPPDFRTARVLELGCAAGGNLLPLALEFPEAHFTGIDLSAEEIKDAQKMKKALKLKNIDFAQKDIMAVDAAFGTFDYIICHGVFSWVPAPVREKILDLCKNNLSPHGLAMISYNALPGWHMVRAVRDMMRFHAESFTSPQDKVAQSRVLLNFLSQNMPGHLNYMKEIIDQERSVLTGVNDTYIYHDHLAGENNPFYLHEFSAMLKSHGLQYIGDTDPAAMYIKNLGPQIAQQFAKLNDAVRQEQYMDFLVNRRFRMSVVAHAGVALNRRVEADRIFDFWLSSNVAPENPDPDPAQSTVFKRREGLGSFTSSDPVATAFFAALARAGLRPMHTNDLVEIVQKKLGIKDPEEVRRVPRGMGIEFAFAGFINLHAAPPAFVDKVSAKPKVYALAQAQARENPARTGVTSAARVSAKTDAFANRLLVAADGSKTVKQLAEAMTGHAGRGDIELRAELKDDPDKMRELVVQTLEKFARCGLLTG